MRRRARRAPSAGLALTLTMVAGCDMSWALGFRQAVSPATTMTCVASALRAEPGVDSVAEQPKETVMYVLRDSTVPGGRRPGGVTLTRRRGRMADSLAVLEISILWHFPAVRVFADSGTTRRLEAFGRAVSARIRRVCVPGAPDSSAAVSCRVIGPGGNATHVPGC